MNKELKLKNIKLIKNKRNGQLNICLPKKIVKDFISENDKVVDLSLWKIIRT